jgi:S-adenosylmethionine hydrolase
VDRFGNLITDLTEQALLDWQQRNGGHRTAVEVGDRTAHGIRAAYGEMCPGDLLAIIGSSGRLEISVNLGNAATTLGVGRGATLVVRSCA